MSVLLGNIQAAANVNASLTWETNTGLLTLDQANFDRIVWLIYETAPLMSMDYKQQSSNCVQFGNFNFGAVAGALGLSLQTGQVGAGIASQINLILWNVMQASGVEQGGKPVFVFHSNWGTPLTGPPYGDNPLEQGWIANGFAFYQAFKGGRTHP